MKDKKKLIIEKMIDKSDSYVIDKGLLPDLSFRFLCIGKSFLSGKTNFCGNILLKPEAYRNDFEGENMFIVSASLSNDEKLKTIIKEKEIPSQNLFSEYDEEMLMAVYQMIEEEYEEAVENQKTPKQYLIFFDDMSFSGIFKGKNFGIINKMFSNGRHINLSVLLTAQKATDIMTSAFENMSAGVFFNCSDRQLEKIETDVNYVTTKKLFKLKFREVCKEKHSFFMVNFSNKPEFMYLDKDFNPITFEEEENKNVKEKNKNVKEDNDLKLIPIPSRSK